MRVGSLFAGIGGFDLAAEWTGWETVWYSEIEPYASAVMKKNFPHAVNLGDVTRIQSAPPVDILCGGFPCQDISLAGKGAGLGGSRSGLWSHYARLIGEIKPRWVVAENVSALRTRGLDRVLKDLDALGYDAEWHCIPAAYVGAPHRRDRIWIIASPRGTTDGSIMGDASGERINLVLDRGCERGSEETASAGSMDVGDTSRRDLGDAERSRLEGYTGNVDGTEGRAQQDRPVAATGLSPREDAAKWWSVEPDVGRVVDGVPSRVDRLRCLGNAIVPQVARMIFEAINRHDIEALM